MGFRNDWNKEIVAQFYATVYFGYIDGERALFWMTEGTLYRIAYPQFASVFGFGQNDANRPKLHLQSPLPVEEMKFMYPRGQVHNAGKLQVSTHIITSSIDYLGKPSPLEEVIRQIYLFMQGTYLLH